MKTEPKKARKSMTNRLLEALGMICWSFGVFGGQVKKSWIFETSPKKYGKIGPRNGRERKTGAAGWIRSRRLAIRASRRRHFRVVKPIDYGSKACFT